MGSLAEQYKEAKRTFTFKAYQCYRWPTQYKADFEAVSELHQNVIHMAIPSTVPPGGRNDRGRLP